MAIEPLAFGKNLRPSTVDVMNKVNELISAVNSADIGALEQIKQDIDGLKQTDTNLSGQIGTLQTNYDELEPRVKQNENDLANVKITLYTPLESTENN